jgi:hypothetical protein
MTTYQIRIKGHLDQKWADWFDGAKIILEENSETLIIFSEADQAALHGVLKKVRDLGLPLISLNQIHHDQDNSDEEKGLQ